MKSKIIKHVKLIKLVIENSLQLQRVIYWNQLPIIIINNAIHKSTASVVEGLESMTYNLVNSLAWVRSPGNAMVVKHGGRYSSTVVILLERWLGNYPPIWLKYCWEKA
jgi:hypothetical protein